MARNNPSINHSMFAEEVVSRQEAFSYKGLLRLMPPSTNSPEALVALPIWSAFDVFLLPLLTDFKNLLGFAKQYGLLAQLYLSSLFFNTGSVRCELPVSKADESGMEPIASGLNL